MKVAAMLVTVLVQAWRTQNKAFILLSSSSFDMTVKQIGRRVILHHCCVEMPSDCLKKDEKPKQIQELYITVSFIL